MKNNVINFKPVSLNDRYLRAKDLCKLFGGLNPATITTWDKSGVLTPYRIGGSKFYRESEINKLIEGSRA